MHIGGNICLLAATRLAAHPPTERAVVAREVSR